MGMNRTSSATRSIAICGKGGVGKTALTVLLTKVLVGSNGKLLVVDADPVVGLPQALGVSVAKTIGDVSEEIIRAARSGGKKEKIEVVSMLDYMILEALVELDGFALLAMGKREGPGCFCPVNDLLRDAIESLSGSFDIILIDGEAGVEQINRRVIRKVDIPLIVTDATIRGVQTAALINEVAHKRKAKGGTRMGLVVNRVREGQEEQLRQAAEQAGLEVVGFIPEDVNITQHDLVGKPIYDLEDNSPSVVAVREIARKLALLA
ncbi:Nitrogenase iron protein [subsurface metagenome]